MMNESSFSSEKDCKSPRKRDKMKFKRTASSMDPQIERHLPIELIMEILIHLPMVSILRFKSVCKLWCSIIEQPDFVYKHMDRTIESIRVFQEGGEHLIRTFWQGLVLERVRKDQYFRLRNPSTRRVLDLPNPNESTSSHTVPCYLSRTRTFKLVFPFPSCTNRSLNFKILTIGADDAWRTLNCPFGYDLGAVKNDKYILGIYSVLVISSTKDKHELLCLEMENETFSRISVGGDSFPDWGSVKAIKWAGKLALYTKAEDHKLHVLVLEDYKNKKWAEKKIVLDLKKFVASPTFLSKDLSWSNFTPYAFSENYLLSHFSHEAHAEFDVASNDCRCFKLSGKNFLSRPTLINFKGMRPLIE